MMQFRYCSRLVFFCFSILDSIHTHPPSNPEGALHRGISTLPPNTIKFFPCSAFSLPRFAVFSFPEWDYFDLAEGLRSLSFILFSASVCLSHNWRGRELSRGLDMRQVNMCRRDLAVDGDRCRRTAVADMSGVRVQSSNNLVERPCSLN